MCLVTSSLLVLVCVVGWLLVARRRRRLVDAKGLAVFISGCDTGIGHRLAILFSDMGCEVFAGCLRPETTYLPQSVRVIPLDVTDEDSVRAAAESVRATLEQKGKGLWSVINNAGVCVFGQFEWQTWRQCEQQVQVNVLGTMRLTKALIPLLRKTKGRIVTISSINGSLAYPGLSVYSATKFALEGLNDALRLELHLQHGIRVITVQPGDYARLTSIMSRHQQNAREMWEEMSSADREECGDFFHNYHRQTLKNYGLTSPTSFEGCHLLRDVEEAVLSIHPRSKYVSASVGCRIVYALMTLSPHFLTDFVLNKIVQSLYNS